MSLLSESLKKHWGCQHPACLTKCRICVCTQCMTGLPRGMWRTCDGMSHSVFSSSTLGSCPPAPPSWKQKIQRPGGRGVFLKHKNFFDVLKWKEVRNKECWMLECDIWKLLGKCQPNRLQAMVPERQNKFQPRLTEALLFWVFIVETGDSLHYPDSISSLSGLL